MLRKIRNKILKKGSYKNREIEPDEIFLDSTNLPEFNIDQFEGRLEKPIPKSTLAIVGISFLIIGLVFTWRIWTLQVSQGEMYATISENNRLQHSFIFADRGVVYDREGRELVWNVRSEEDDFSRRQYIEMEGLSHVLGFVSYPLKDSTGIYYQEEFIGRAGVENIFDNILAGESGLKIVETDAFMQTQSESIIRPPKDGENLRLTIDSYIQNALFKSIEKTAGQSGFDGGAGIIMDIKTGEILALTSYPEFNSQMLSDGKPSSIIHSYTKDRRKPFLNRALSGLYTPGSIVKLFLAIGAMNENIIQPEDKILSTGQITIPNPYFPDKASVFVDWKAHGLVDMREAIAVSSNVYFYEIGGGYEDQEGLGIENIEKYMRMFGFGERSGIHSPFLSIEEEGTIPNPAWKRDNFEDDIWRIGNTYHTAIGQYGFQITPIQAARAVSAIANDGSLLVPTLNLDDNVSSEKIRVPKRHFDVVKEGMRLAVTEGTAKGINIPQVVVAAKTGTAELGITKKFVNSWIIGFFPYENPKYAFAVIMERGKKGTLAGALFAMRQFLEWMAINAPEYLE